MARIIVAIALPLLAACGPTSPDERRASSSTGETIAGVTANDPGTGATPDAPDLTIWRPGTDVPRRLDLVPLPEAATAGQTKLDNGILPDPKAFPATLVDRTSKGETRCTATLIGPETILTAAHCVDGGGRGPSQVVSGGRAEFGGMPRTYRCIMAAEYTAAPRKGAGGVRHPADFALCRLNAPVPTGLLRAERLAIVPEVPVNSQLLLTGFGCDDMFVDEVNEIDARRNDGRLRIGDERVASSGQSGAFGIPGPLITTLKDGKDPALCPGDSGGAAFTGATVKNQAAVGRLVVSVNSAVGWKRDDLGRVTFRSYLAPLSSPAFSALVARYRSANPGVRICGLDPTMPAGVCRA